jgi:putative addiction module killer protein
MKTVRRTDMFSDWLANLRDRQAVGRITVAIQKLAVGLGDVEAVGQGVSELRLHFGPGYRLYFVERQGTVIILLCGGAKSSQAGDIKEARRIARLLE